MGDSGQPTTILLMVLQGPLFLLLSSWPQSWDCALYLSLAMLVKASGQL